MAKRQKAESAEVEEAASQQPGMQSLTRAIAVLDIVSAASKPLRFTSLLEATALPKGTLHRILQTLVDARYLKLNGQDQSYRLGPKMFEMAHRVWDQFDLRGAAAPELERLMELTGEAVRLSVLDGSDVLHIDQREMPKAVRIANGVGSRTAAYASALGKAILAYLPPAKRRLLLDEDARVPFTEHTLVGEGDLDQHLNLVRARGYAVSVEEHHPGVSAVAAAILDHKAEPIGAIGVVGPSFRLTPSDLHALGREVMEAGRRVSVNVGEAMMSISVNPRPIGVVRDDVELAIPGDDFLGEGPHWSERDQRLYWVDILSPAFLSGDPASGRRSVRGLPELIGCAIPRVSGGFVAATESGVKLMTSEGALTPFAEPEADRPDNRFNDGKCDRLGRLWVGSLAIGTEPGRGALWRVDADARFERKLSSVHVSNGLGWSPDDRTMYFTDSGERVIYAFDFDLARGDIENQRVFARFDEVEGIPDGLAVDVEGGVWCAVWDGWRVVRFDPSGAVERVIDLPVPRPTSCCFGGPDLKTLFVTTARIRLSAQTLAEAPLSGGVLSVATPVAGQRETLFAG